VLSSNQLAGADAAWGGVRDGSRLAAPLSSQPLGRSDAGGDYAEEGV